MAGGDVGGDECAGLAGQAEPKPDSVSTPMNLRLDVLTNGFPRAAREEVSEELHSRASYTMTNTTASKMPLNANGRRM